MDPLAYRQFYRRHLPHWQPAHATFFSTFRLSGTLPRAAIRDIEARSPNTGAVLSTDDGFARTGFIEFEQLLDASTTGPSWMSSPSIADIVSECVCFTDQRLCTLWAYCVMPNHVHVVFTPLHVSNSTPVSLARIMHCIKSHSARRANTALQRTGAFWQHESYDHVIRDLDEFESIVRYVIDNPVKAGLVATAEEWRWTYLRTNDSASWELAPQGHETCC